MAVGDQHVYPLREEGAHTFVGTSCPCGPKVEIQPSGAAVVIHREMAAPRDKAN